ncbi:RNA-directed DNA polymerase, eukaryota, partial [Tanacetum coccineum]
PLASVLGDTLSSWDLRSPFNPKNSSHLFIMGIDDWHVVSRKKHGYRSYEDDVAKISISIYVSNLPETFSAKDLFHACNKLVGNLCTVWVGRYKLQGNKARFGRPPLNGRNIRNSKSDDRHLGGFKEPNVRPTNGNKETRNNSFASVLKSNQPNNLSSSNMIHALPHLCGILYDIKISYLVDITVEFRELNTKNKINFVAVQETKLESINLFSIKDLWGNSFFDFSFSSSAWSFSELFVLDRTSFRSLTIIHARCCYDLGHPLLVSINLGSQKGFDKLIKDSWSYSRQKYRLGQKAKGVDGPLKRDENFQNFFMALINRKDTLTCYSLGVLIDGRLDLTKLCKAFFLERGDVLECDVSAWMEYSIKRCGSEGIQIFQHTGGTPRSFPRLYALELKKGITVADKLIDASFVASFRRNPRGGVEEEQLHHLVELVGSISLSPSNDRWAWLLGSSGEFSVHSARTFIDDILLPFVGDVTRWVKVVPIKVNILAWKVCLDKLPTRLNLSLRGIDIPSIICPNCGLAGESCSHLFYSCNLARTLWRKIARWWEIDITDFSCYEEWIAWFKTTRFSKAQKEMLEGVFYVMWWMIWKFRNQVLFGSSHPRMELLFDDIVSYSFTWCSNRCKNNIDWISWMKCPKSISL